LLDAVVWLISGELQRLAASHDFVVNFNDGFDFGSRPPISPLLAKNGKGGSCLPDVDPQETAEWLDALEGVIDCDGSKRANILATSSRRRSRRRGWSRKNQTQSPCSSTAGYLRDFDET